MPLQSLRARLPLAYFFVVPLYAGLILVLHESMTTQLTIVAVFAASLMSSLAGFAFFSPMRGDVVPISS